MPSERVEFDGGTPRQCHNATIAGEGQKDVAELTGYQLEGIHEYRSNSSRLPYAALERRQRDGLFCARLLSEMWIMAARPSRANVALA